MKGIEILTILKQAAADIGEYSTKLTHYREVCIKTGTTADYLYEDLQKSIVKSISDMDVAANALDDVTDVDFDLMPREFVIHNVNKCKEQLTEMLQMLNEIRDLVVKVCERRRMLEEKMGLY